MVLDMTYVSYFVLAVVGYYAVLFIGSLRRPRRPGRTGRLGWRRGALHRRTGVLGRWAMPRGEHRLPRRSSAVRRRSAGQALPGVGPEPVVVFVVPARNEELVIEATLTRLCVVDYPELRVLVMNDGSTDRTSELAHALAGLDDRIRVIDRTGGSAGRGKSAVLNHAYAQIRAMVSSSDAWLAGRGDDDVLLGVVDADGFLDAHVMGAVIPFFADAGVGQVQIGVQIANARSGILTRLQDMEFVGFSCLVQAARDRVGSVGLGGNGQFTRLRALESLGAEPWRPEALTEDLELGLSLVEAGWASRFTSAAYVHQQGLTRWRPLLRQRTRWIQGHYLSWRHLPALVRAKGVRGLGRFDLMTYLLLVALIVVITGELVIDWLGSAGLVVIRDTSLEFLPHGIGGRAIALLISLLPPVTFIVTYQRAAAHPLRWWEVPGYGAIFTLYTYVWLIATARAWIRIALRRGHWVKTPRVALARGTSGSGLP